MHFSKLFTHCPTCGSSSFITNSEKSCRCHACGFVYFINASAAVAVFIVNEQGELLVCKRGKAPAKGTWDLPGGFVDENENAEQAVSREINEELNLKISECKYLFSFPNRYEYSGLTIPTLDLFFECKVADLSGIQAADDVAECFFVPINDVNADLFGLESIKNGVTLFIRKL
jgi:NAD+ diphosphatase